MTTEDSPPHDQEDITEEHSFDELAKGLATGAISRGKALRWMGGALVGAALAAVPGMAWAATCATGKTLCGDRCVNLKTNERHCGSCFNRCHSTQTCCGGRCVNLQKNERHCGSCFNRCPEGSECVGGVCQQVGGCPSGTQVCGSTCCQSGETCVNGRCCPSTQACGSVCCQSGETCVNGACSTSPVECTVWDSEGQHTEICPSGTACCPDIGCYDPNAGQACCVNDGGFYYICQVGIDCYCLM